MNYSQNALPDRQVKLLMQLPDRSTFSGKRDYAILRLLWDNALRRGEIARLNISDVNLSDRFI
ncbi:tyrosine-type recombinase/integrase [Okeania sp. KiyG1]|uniref:tyrosine-type recombinase/integrase n=1 Tax=Okeania sp. KiyG1 TaxID=2720165 RepID=UPI0035C8E241